MIPANTGDTGGTLLGIFQGYNNEVPYGGTSGLANLVPVNAALAAVEPPLMNWSGNATLTAATALTTPQEFFLGSQYTAIAAPVPTALSASKRWGLIIYPNIRFGYKKTGDSFIARRVWWRIPLVYQTAQQTMEDQGGADHDLPLSERSGQLRPVGIRNSFSASDLGERQSANWRQCGWYSLGKRGLYHGLDLWKPDSVGRRNLWRHQFAAGGECSQPGDGWRNTLFEQRIRRASERAKHMALTPTTPAPLPSRWLETTERYWWCR